MINSGVELSSVCLMRSLDLTVKVGSTRFNRPKLDEVLVKLVLKVLVEELGSRIGLHDADRKIKTIEHLSEELNGILGTTAGIKSQHPNFCVVVNCSKLVSTCNYFHGINLHSVSRKVFGISVVLLLSSFTPKWRNV